MNKGIKVKELSKKVFKNAASTLTLQEASEAYKNKIATAVNDGKDITLIIEKEVNVCERNKFY